VLEHAYSSAKSSFTEGNSDASRLYKYIMETDDGNAFCQAKIA
jgi:hypothetical protein